MRIVEVQINRVSSVKVDKCYHGKTQLANSNVTSPLSDNILGLNFPSAVIGRSQVCFKGNGDFALAYEPEIDTNFFHLPPGCEPDEYQIAAAKYLHMGESVLVTAPTGTGKTAIAQYIISKNLAEGRRTFYTTPLKALSNQKVQQLTEIYKSFQSQFGESNVGLLTGDVKINPDAPIVVMTTEIYKNMLGAPGRKHKPGETPHQLQNLGTVIFDELHYMGDYDRGRVWEQSIMMSGRTQLLSLSATIGNGQEVADWMKQVKGKPTYLVEVPEEKRHVPLSFHNDVICPYDPTEPFVHHADLVQHLKEEDRLTAAFFIYSKRKINAAIDYFKERAHTNGSFVLTSPKEQRTIQGVIDEYKAKGLYLGEGLDFEALKYGYAPHSSGLLLVQKELIEELGQANLVKVIFTTETLGAGINFPIRTAVMTSTRKPVGLQKFADDDDGKRQINPNEFKQQAGRAGRRGIDTEGFVYTMPETAEEKNAFERLINSTPDELVSSYEPSYSEIAAYHKDTKETGPIEDFFRRSFMAYDKNKGARNQNADRLLDVFKQKRGILSKFEFIDHEHNLLPKGSLLAELNGYAQIPVVEMLFDRKIPIGSLKEFAAGIASLSTVSEAVADKLERQKDYEAKHKRKSGFVERDTETPAPEKILTSYEKESPALTSFVEDLETYLEGYNSTMQTIDAKHENVAQDKGVVERLFTWAKLNTESSDSIMNWKRLFQLHSKDADEGGMFAEIYRTVNLLKQIGTMSEKATALAELAQHRGYYEAVSTLARDAVKLIQKESIFIHNI